MYIRYTHHPTDKFLCHSPFPKRVRSTRICLSYSEHFAQKSSYMLLGYVCHRTFEKCKNVVREVAAGGSNWSKAYFTPFHAIAVNREQKFISTRVHTSVTWSAFTPLHTTGKLEIYIYKNPSALTYVTWKAKDSKGGGRDFP